MGGGESGGMADAASGGGKPNVGGTADEGARAEGSEEKKRNEHDGRKAFIACGGELAEPRV
jgi:hypothetical protein